MDTSKYGSDLSDEFKRLDAAFEKYINGFIDIDSNNKEKAVILLSEVLKKQNLNILFDQKLSQHIAKIKKDKIWSENEAAKESVKLYFKDGHIFKIIDKIVNERVETDGGVKKAVEEWKNPPV